MERENWFGFACRVAFLGWTAYCAWLLLDWLSLVDKGMALVRESLADGRGDRADHFAPNVAVSTAAELTMWRWVAVAGFVATARWAFGFGEWRKRSAKLAAESSAPPTSKTRWLRASTKRDLWQFFWVMVALGAVAVVAGFLEQR